MEFSPKRRNSNTEMLLYDTFFKKISQLFSIAFSHLIIKVCLEWIFYKMFWFNSIFSFAYP